MKIKPCLSRITGVFNDRFRRTTVTGILILASVVLATSSRANILSWSGGGGANANWNNSANWGFAGVPGNGDTVIFPASQPNLINTNNITSLVLNQIRFAGAGGGYDIRGNAFTLTNSIVATNTAGANIIENTITLATATNVLIVVSNGVSLTFEGNLGSSGTVGVNKAGLGTLVYQGPNNNTYSGTTLISAGTLDLNVGGLYAFEGPLVIGDGTGAGSPTIQNLQGEEYPPFVPITINTNGMLNLNNYNDTIGTNLTLTSATIATGTGTLTVSPNCTITVENDTGNGFNGNFSTGSGTLTIQGNGGITFFSVVSGSANIVVNDASIEWYNNNTFSGNVTVNGIGLVDCHTTMALGNPTNSLTLNGSSFVGVADSINLTNQTVTFNNNNTLYPFEGSIDVYDFFSGTNTWHASFVLNTNCVVQIQTNCCLNLIGPISGPGGVTIQGSGVLGYYGSTANTYSGLTIVNQGELDLGKSGAAAIAPFQAGLFIGDETDPATVVYKGPDQIYSVVTPVVISSNATLNLNGFSDVISPLTMISGTVSTAGGQLGLNRVYQSGLSTIFGTVLPEPLVVSNDVSSFLLIYANILPYGNYGITMTGQGLLGLQASNSFTGPIILQQGWIGLGNSYGLGATNSPIVVSNGATLELTGDLYITNKPLVMNGPGEPGYAPLYTEEGINVWAGPITNNVDSTLGAYFSGCELHINGTISGPGGIECIGDSSGAGTIFFEGSAANTYAGLTTVDPGVTLTLSKSPSIAAVPGNIVVDGTLAMGGYVQLSTGADVLVDSGGLFSFGSYYEFFNTLRGSGQVTFGVNGYMNIGETGGSSEFDGTISGTGFVGGYTIAKYGAGTFTLTGTNTYLNETVIYNGNLVVNGQQLQSPVIVNSGTTLAGWGTVGSITGAGTVSPGNGGPGALTCSNLTFTSSGAFVVNLTGPTAGSGYSQLNPISLGPTNILANATLQVLPAFTTSVAIGQQFTIVSNATPFLFNGTFSGLPEGAQFTASGYTFRISYVGGTGNDTVLTLLGVPANTLTLNAVTTGWYDSNGYHTNNNLNYVAGGVSSSSYYRDFFVFNAPISTNAIVHAELLVNNYSIFSPSNQDTFVLREVSTSISNLVKSWTSQTAIYNDLGTGAVYSVRSLATNETGQTAIIPLNAKFISDITAASGGQIALGGSVASLNAALAFPQDVFSFSAGVPGDVRLRLVYGTNQLINVASRGWYDDTGNHAAGNLNYLAGYYNGTTFRDYFMFNLPNTSGQTVNAQLLINAYEIENTNGFTTFQLYDVTNAITQLTNNQSSATGIYADLGSGTIYGGRDIYTNESGQVAAIPLNSGFIAAAQAASGSSIALGGAVSLTASSSNQDVFAFVTGASATNVQLWLSYYKKPVSHPVISGAPVNLGGGLYQYHLTGTVGITNEIQGSFDFQRWDYITDVPMNEAGGSFTVTATNLNGLPYRFYRAEPLQ